MARYQVLKLPLFFEIEFSIASRKKENVKEAMKATIQKLQSNERLAQIEPVFYREGWYYDRQDKKCWYEWRNTAWETEYRYFQHELHSLNERILQPVEVQAIHTLLIYDTSSTLRREFAYLLSGHNSKLMLRNIRRNIQILRRKYFPLKGKQNDSAHS